MSATNFDVRQAIQGRHRHHRKKPPLPASSSSSSSTSSHHRHQRHHQRDKADDSNSNAIKKQEKLRLQVPTPTPVANVEFAQNSDLFAFKSGNLSRVLDQFDNRFQAPGFCGGTVAGHLNPGIAAAAASVPFWTNFVSDALAFIKESFECRAAWACRHIALETGAHALAQCRSNAGVALESLATSMGNAIQRDPGELCSRLDDREYQPLSDDHLEVWERGECEPPDTVRDSDLIRQTHAAAGHAIAQLSRMPIDSPTVCEIARAIAVVMQTMLEVPFREATAIANYRAFTRRLGLCGLIKLSLALWWVCRSVENGFALACSIYQRNVRALDNSFGAGNPGEEATYKQAAMEAANREETRATLEQIRREGDDSMTRDSQAICEPWSAAQVEAEAAFAESKRQLTMAHKTCLQSLSNYERKLMYHGATGAECVKCINEFKGIYGVLVGQVTEANDAADLRIAMHQALFLWKVVLSKIPG